MLRMPIDGHSSMRRRIEARNSRAAKKIHTLNYIIAYKGIAATGCLIDLHDS